MTKTALEMSHGKFYAGYSDFHPGMDTVAAWRNPELLCALWILLSVVMITSPA